MWTPAHAIPFILSLSTTFTELTFGSHQPARRGNRPANSDLGSYAALSPEHSTSAGAALIFARADFASVHITFCETPLQSSQ
jgi:hypothetical protein